MLQDRGVLVSPESERSLLAELLARLPPNNNLISEMVRASTRRRRRVGRLSSQTLKLPEGSRPEDFVRRIVEEVKQTRSKALHEDILVKGEDSDLEVKLEFEEFDPGATKLRQRSQRESAIQVEVQEDKVVISYESGVPRACGFASAVAAALTDAGCPDERRSIFATDFASGPECTSFLVKVASTLEHHALETVTSVKLSNWDEEFAPIFVDEDVESEIGNENALSDGGRASDDSDDDGHIEATSIIRKALLSGEGILQSEAYKKFTNSGLFASRLRWKSTILQRADLATEANAVEIELGFSGAHNDGALEIELRGVWRKKSRGTGFRVNPDTPQPPETRVYQRLILERAMRVFQEQDRTAPVIEVSATEV